ncbi:MAG: sulfurtransferase [Betaproteobacteria bacterium]|nr:sulfurtransferase [Betaproteobacteria bacterium]MBK7278436.1 sulfurtransferase [Betaproteobacteria bacterium]MBK9685721.1 sulfurtransferase [Betaproteobacteria bacterium]MBP6462541.1 sulfurtransferase [Rubrivivax sp.]
MSENLDADRHRPRDLASECPGLNRPLRRRIDRRRGSGSARCDATGRMHRRRTASGDGTARWCTAFAAIRQGGNGIGNQHGGFMIPRFSSRLVALVSGVLALVFTSLSALAQPLVDAAWAVANAGKPGIVFVDLQPPADFQKGHIPGAVNSNYGKDGWRQDRARDKVPDMFPENIEPLVALIGRLGIDNDTHVVLVPPGYNVTDMGAGTRIYWTFKVLGHDKVSILNGGMNAYTNDDKRPLQTGAVTPAAKVFKANLRQDMLITMEDVKKAQAAGQLLIDARPEDQYAGINRHPKSTQSGTIAGAKSVPHNWMAVNGGGMFRPKAQAEQLYAVANVAPTGEHIQFCNTGHWASIGWFVASEIVGNKQSKMYDGSMVEWTMLKGGPVESRVKLQ